MEPRQDRSIETGQEPMQKGIIAALECHDLVAVH